MPYPFDRKRLAKIVRVSKQTGAAVSLLVLVASPFLLDLGLRYYLESYLSLMNGGQVNIASLNLSWLNGTGTVQGIQVTQHSQTLRNLVEIDQIRFDFDRSALLSRRLIIGQMQVEGIRYDTARERSGIVDPDSYPADPPTALLDRVNPGLYDTVRTSLNRNPLTNLVSVSMDRETSRLIQSGKQALDALAGISSFSKSVEQQTASWQHALDILNNGRSEAKARTADKRLLELATLRTHIEEGAENLEKQVEKIRLSLPAQIDRAVEKLGFAAFDSPDMTPDLLGQKVLNNLERIAYWVEVSRRRLEDPSLVVSAASAAAAGSTKVGTPQVQIRKISLLSSAGHTAHQGTVTGTITGFTTLPVGRSEPLRVALEAAFPDLKISGVKVRAEVDHTQIPARESLDLEVESAPFHQWALEDAPDLRLALASGTLGFSGSYQTSAKEISANWKLKLKDGDLKVSSRSVSVESTLKEILAPIARSIEIEGSASGQADHTQFKLSSNLGRTLATELGQTFRLPLKATESSLRDELVRYAQNALNQVAQKLRKARAELATSVSSSAESWELKKKSG